MNPETDESRSDDALRRMPPPGPPQSGAEFGKQLTAARTKKGLTIEAVVQQTRIPRKFLVALEENRFDEFPAMVYLRGFLKSYCDFLELEFEPLWRQVSEAGAQGAAAARAPSASEPAPAAHASKPAAPARVPARPASHAHEDDADSSSDEGPWAGLSVLAFVAAGSLALLWGLKSRHTPQLPPAPPESVPAALQPYQKKPEPSLVLDFAEDAWISVTLDGELKFEGRVPRGARQEWKAKRMIVLRASDPAALKPLLNGAPYALPAPDKAGLYRIESP